MADERIPWGEAHILFVEAFRHTQGLSPENARHEVQIRLQALTAVLLAKLLAAVQSQTPKEEK